MEVRPHRKINRKKNKTDKGWKCQCWGELCYFCTIYD